MKAYQAHFLRARAKKKKRDRERSPEATKFAGALHRSVPPRCSRRAVSACQPTADPTAHWQVEQHD